jgi:hypothetical protein
VLDILYKEIDRFSPLGKVVELLTSDENKKRYLEDVLLYRIDASKKIKEVKEVSNLLKRELLDDEIRSYLFNIVNKIGVQTHRLTDTSFDVEDIKEAYGMLSEASRLEVNPSLELLIDYNNLSFTSEVAELIGQKIDKAKVEEKVADAKEKKQFLVGKTQCRKGGQEFVRRGDFAFY